MNLRRLVATSAIAIASLGVWTGTAYAQPATTPAVPTTEQNSEVNWASRVEGGKVVTTVDAGLFRASDDGKSVVLEDNEGNQVVSLPLSFNLNGIEFPYGVEYTDAGRTVTLIPNLAAPMGLTPAALEQNAASPAENLKAEQAFQSQLALASAVGGLTGTIIGAVAGAVLGLPLLGPASVITIPIAGAAGGFIGTLVAGGPTLVVAGLDLLNTYNAAPGTSKFAE